MTNGWFRRPWLKLYHYQFRKRVLCGQIVYNNDTPEADHPASYPAHCMTCQEILDGKRGRRKA